MSQKDQIFLVEPGVSKRLDIFVAEKMAESRAQVQKFLKNGQILVNGVIPRKTGYRVKEGDEVRYSEQTETPEEKKQKKNKKQILPDITLVSETPDYLIVNKPAGVLVHSTEAHEAGTLVHWLLAHYPKIKNIGGRVDRPGIVHRLDKEASGLLVVARTEKMFQHLKEQFQQRITEKEYLVLVHGIIPRDYEKLDFVIDRGKEGKMVARPKVDPTQLASMAKAQPGKEALSEFWVEKRFVNHTLVRVRIHTGRTHQIRVHMFAYNHPVVGDMLYYQKKMNRKRDMALGRLWLHAAKLCFLDLEDKKVCFEAPLPSKLADFLQEIR